MTVVTKNRLEEGKKTAKDGKKICHYILTWLTVLLFTSCKFSPSPAIDSQEFNLAPETTVTLDSITLDFNFYPERWSLCDDTLWIINSRDSLFLTGFDIVSRDIVCSWGNIGGGPQDYISPGIVENSANKLLLYGNTENKVVGYHLCNGSLLESFRGKMPVWLSEHGLPKPYTRITSVNDSTFVGTYFLPKKVGADILNINSGTLLNEIILGIEQPKKNMSGPYEFKVSASGSKLVFAYRYINRIEFLQIEPDYTSKIMYSYGNTDDQSDLYNADKDDDMIKYFSDIQCDSKYAYLLYHGVETNKLEYSPTYLLIYDLDSYKNVANIRLDYYFDQLLVNNAGKIILSSPNHEDQIYVFQMNHDNLTL